MPRRPLAVILGTLCLLLLSAEVAAACSPSPQVLRVLCRNGAQVTWSEYTFPDQGAALDPACDAGEDGERLLAIIRGHMGASRATSPASDLIISPYSPAAARAIEGENAFLFTCRSTMRVEQVGDWMVQREEGRPFCHSVPGLGGIGTCPERRISPTSLVAYALTTFAWGMLPYQAGLAAAAAALLLPLLRAARAGELGAWLRPRGGTVWLTAIGYMLFALFFAATLVDLAVGLPLIYLVACVLLTPVRWVWS